MRREAEPVGEVGPFRRIGYWRSNEDDRLPDPLAFVDGSWDEGERGDVLSHLRHGLLARAYAGFSGCRFCGEIVGSLELTDGKFLWPEGLAHDVENHSVSLPDEFVQHIRDLAEMLHDAVVEDDWWRSQGRG